jgi:Amt family ammonium transporter
VKRILLTLCLAATFVLGQTPAATPVPITDADLKSVAPPSADARVKGDPDGNLTGNVSDVVVADSKKGLTVGDLVNQVGQNRIGINFMWTLFAGFLVMFMQAGFAIVETGLCRAKNANHTMMMNFMV